MHEDQCRWDGVGVNVGRVWSDLLAGMLNCYIWMLHMRKRWMEYIVVLLRKIISLANRISNACAVCIMDATSCDGSLPSNQALSGSSTYAVHVQSYINVMLFFSVPTACVNAPVSDGPLYRSWRVWLWYIGLLVSAPSKIYAVSGTWGPFLYLKFNFTDSFFTLLFPS